MKQAFLFISALLLTGILNVYTLFSQPYTEQPLWPNGIENNPINYPEEKTRTFFVDDSSLIKNNRIFSCVSNPAYVMFKPEKPNGVGVVICPGGGFKDIWFDREGLDIALYFAKFGITSMVLKYRTLNPEYKTVNLSLFDYGYQIYADANQAIYTLRKQAKELGLNKKKIGICGFSAGGLLAISTTIKFGESGLPAYASYLKGEDGPDFACLIYPAIIPEFYKVIEAKSDIPPIFLANGLEDKKTPVKDCIELFTALQKKKVKTELHVYAKGNHGFGSGLERGYATGTWRDSFIAWLKDMEFMF